MTRMFFLDNPYNPRYPRLNHVSSTFVCTPAFLGELEKAAFYPPSSPPRHKPFEQEGKEVGEGVEFSIYLSS